MFHYILKGLTSEKLRMVYYHIVFVHRRKSLFSIHFLPFLSFNWSTVIWIGSHSYGEYVFDHSWADAYYSYGRYYYPKLQCCVPFTPVTGQRILVKNVWCREQVFNMLVVALKNLTDKVVLFCSWIRTPCSPLSLMNFNLVFFYQTSLLEWNEETQILLLFPFFHKKSYIHCTETINWFLIALYSLTSMVLLEKSGWKNKLEIIFWISVTN